MYLRLSLLIPLITLLCFPQYSRPSTQQQYTITDIGALPGLSSAIATGVNGLGHVVGGSGDRAFVWRDGAISDLGSLSGFQTFARAINNRDQVVGRSVVNGSTGEYHAFLWQDGQMRDLGTLGGPFSEAFAINDRGQIVGESATPEGPTHAFIWQDGVMRDIGGITGFGINNSGNVVGWTLSPSGTAIHAFLLSDGVFQDLGTLPGDVSSIARGINDSGVVVGFSNSSDGTSRAVTWRRGAISPLISEAGVGSANATSINDGGLIVGLVIPSTSFTSHAALWQEGQLLDLDDLLPPDPTFVSSGAVAINNRGQIAVTRVGSKRSGLTRALLLTPN